MQQLILVANCDSEYAEPFAAHVVLDITPEYAGQVLRVMRAVDDLKKSGLSVEHLAISDYQPSFIGSDTNAEVSQEESDRKEAILDYIQDLFEESRKPEEVEEAARGWNPPYVIVPAGREIPERDYTAVELPTDMMRAEYDVGEVRYACYLKHQDALTFTGSIPREVFEEVAREVAQPVAA